MHSQKNDGLGVSGIAQARHWPPFVAGYDPGPAVDVFGKEIIAGPVEVFYGDVPDTGVRKGCYNGA